MAADRTGVSFFKQCGSVPANYSSKRYLLTPSRARCGRFISDQLHSHWRVDKAPAKSVSLHTNSHVRRASTARNEKLKSRALPRSLLNSHMVFITVQLRENGRQNFLAIKHCHSRWLSLERCVNCTLNKLEAQKSYFNSHAGSEEIAERLRGPSLKLRYYFWASN